MSLDNLPADIRKLRRWVCYQVEDRGQHFSDGTPKVSKVPVNPHTGRPASTTNPKTWGTYTEATRGVALHGCDGIGIVLGEIRYDTYLAGIDLDDCIQPDGELTEQARDILRRLDTYTEKSVSGKGVKALCHVKRPLPRDARKRSGNIEFYAEKRFFALTGDRLPDFPTTINRRERQFHALHRELLPPHLECSDRDKRNPAVAGAVAEELILSDAEVSERARIAKNGEKFSALYDRGDVSAYDNDDSRADEALCCILAFWTQRDPERIDRLFRQSALMRDKWERADYRERTIRLAIETCREVYGKDSGTRWLDDTEDEEGDAVPEQPEKVRSDRKQQKVNPFHSGLCRACDLPSATTPETRGFGLYLGRVTLVSGETGCGKSAANLNIGVHAALGEPLWGINFPRPMKVLYIDPENAGDFRNGANGDGGLSSVRLDRIGKGRPANLVFHDGLDVNLNEPEHMAALQAVVIEQKFDIVVLDPLANLFGTKDENDNAEAARQMKTLTALSRKTGATVIAVHHTGKGQDSGGDGYGRGASARLAAADVGMIFRVRLSGSPEQTDDTYESFPLERRDVCRLQIVKDRPGEFGKASLYLRMAGNDRFDLAAFSDWKCSSSGAATGNSGKSEKARTEIPLYLADGEERSVLEIVAAMKIEGIGEKTVRDTLKELAGEGQLTSRTAERGALFYRKNDEVVADV